MKAKLGFRIALFLFLGALIFAVIYALHAASLVTNKMGGQKWDLPSRVYSAPIFLFSGVPFSEKDLRAYLDRLGYKETKNVSVDVGQYKRTGATWNIGVRAFRDATDYHPAHTLQFILSGGTIHDIFEIKGNDRKEVHAASLEPEELGLIFASKKQERTVVRLDDLPFTLREAILLMEDRKFYQHHGLSPRGTLRAFFSNLRGGKVTQGGSTLTQQLMKNFFLTPERTVTRKIREAIMTLVAEALYSKDEIFEAYVNEIYLGQRGSTAIHGFGEAARFYFSKAAKNLTLGEQAMLVGLISSPGVNSPYQRPEMAKARRDLVLKILFQGNKISEKAYKQALAEPLEPRGRAKEQRWAPYFLDHVRDEIIARFANADLEREGYEIHTTLDLRLQALATRSLLEGLPDLEKRAKPNNGEKLQVALLALHPQTGVIKAMVGGREYGETQFNRITQAHRQPGSLVKPFVAAIALSPLPDGGPPPVTLASILEDQPTTFSFAGKDWSPRNYESVFAGKTTVRGAIERSLNVATINLAAGVGLQRIADEFERFGFPKPSPVPSLVLGTMEATPLIVARAFTTFSNGGLRTSPFGVSALVSQRGERLAQRSTEVVQVISPEVAFLITYLMEGVVDRGTARAVRAWGLSQPLAGKTGTTNENRDSWFVGYSPTLLTLTWVGYDNNAPTGLTGASGALPLWIRFMKEALRGEGTREFVMPKKIQWVEIDRLEGCRGKPKETLREAFLPGTEPRRCK